MYTIGLTGGIASGKSLAGTLLAARGATVIDVDRVAHETYAPGTPGFDLVAGAFGPQVVGADGMIDRRVLGGIVFGDAAALKRLTDIVWPLVRARIQAQAAEKAAESGVLVFEAAVLTEASWQDLFDEVWVVTITPSTGRERLMARNNLTGEQADARIGSQLPDSERVKGAVVVIDNSGDREALEAAVDAAWQALTARSAKA